MKTMLPRRIGAWFFPRRCGFCGRLVKIDETVCGECKGELPRVLPPLCPLCGREKGRCACRAHRRHFLRCVSPFYYEGLARKGILRLKLYGKTYAAEAFAEAMAQTVKREYAGVVFDGIVPVPVSRRTQKARGYNQSFLLASALGARIGCQAEETLAKLVETPAQRELSALERSGNVMGVFDLRSGCCVTGKTLLLVDDILTTGATLDECAKILKIYGAAEVYAAVGAAAMLEKTTACQTGENTV
ncbi:MAG: ComF family protein [Clostridiales bacterium]|nr:ComF family protein [Clostridiales bacterium]